MRPASGVILDHLPLVTLATAVLVAVDLHFRSLVAPLVNLLAVGIAYIAVTRALGWLSQAFGFAAPSEVEPVVVVVLLLFGIVTDYAIFFLSGFQERLREGLPGREAASRGRPAASA